MGFILTQIFFTIWTYNRYSVSGRLKHLWTNKQKTFSFLFYRSEEKNISSFLFTGTSTVQNRDPIGIEADFFFIFFRLLKNGSVQNTIRKISVSFSWIGPRDSIVVESRDIKLKLPDGA